VTNRVIPQRELRNRVGEVLRAAEAGETFTITVRGRPVARLGPPDSGSEPRIDVARATLRRLLAEPVDDDLARELEAAEEPVGEPWPE
jgi:prevent-host-death family protein